MPRYTAVQKQTQLKIKIHKNELYNLNAANVTLGVAVRHHYVRRLASQVSILYVALRSNILRTYVQVCKKKHQGRHSRVAVFAEGGENPIFS